MKRNITTGLLLMALFSGYGAFAQDAKERAWITKHYDMDKARELEAEYAAQSKKEREEALALAKVNGWPVTYVGEDGAYRELKKVMDGKPVYFKTFNNNAAVTIKANRVHNNGGAGLNLEGQGMIVGEWDEGPVRRTHQEFTSFRVTQKDGAGGSASLHATHVAGTMIASGVDPSAKGMAPQASLWANNWGDDTSEMVSQAGQGLLVSNHSYGIDADVAPAWLFGAYDAESFTWDNITFNFPYYQPVVAAGNDRNNLPPAYPSSKSGRELITQQATSKNIITVAAVSGPSPISIASFSNFGPTDDRRIKPDISARGVNVYSTGSSANNSYVPESGTSMASPGISGGLILLQQHYKNVNNGTFMRAATLKGLMSHTAVDVGSVGPDFQYGWGVMDVEAGAAVITNNGITSHIIEGTLTQGGNFTKAVKAKGDAPLKVTLTWTDRPGNPSSSEVTTPVLVNDLDVRLVKTAGNVTYMPWRLNQSFVTGTAQRDDNFVDNIEKIEVYNNAGQGNSIEIPAANEEFTVVVTHKGTLQGSNQAFSLIISGVDATASVDKLNAESKINMWPNPANETLNLSFGDLASEDVKVEIYDIQGRLMLNKNISASADQVLNISGLSSGSYIVNISSDTFKVTKKLVKK